jgi:outer membrane beta-barrel protein
MKNFIFLILFMQNIAMAQTAKSPSPSGEGEEVDLDKITQKYWAEGKETELGVVQNRKYTTAKKVELGLLFGTLSTDPFLSVHHLGGTLGYHFSPYTSIHFTSWKSFVTASDALKTFEAETTASVNTNKPLAYYGTEVKQNFLYGKASIFGKMIIYVDLFVLGGVGLTKTESGSYFTPTLGLGQKIYLNERMSINLDYRIMRYNETILSKNAATLGQAVGERSNTTDAVSLGLSLFLF